MPSRDHQHALDQGTSSTRANLNHPHARNPAMAQPEYRHNYPQPG